MDGPSSACEVAACVRMHGDPIVGGPLVGDTMTMVGGAVGEVAMVVVAATATMTVMMVMAPVPSMTTMAAVSVTMAVY